GVDRDVRVLGAGAALGGAVRVRHQLAGLLVVGDLGARRAVPARRAATGAVRARVALQARALARRPRTGGVVRVARPGTGATGLRQGALGVDLDHRVRAAGAAGAAARAARP